MRETYCRRRIEERVAQTMVLWEGCARTHIPVAREFTNSERLTREQAYDEALCAAEKEIEAGSSQTRTGAAAMERRLLHAFARFSASALHLQPEAISVLKDQFIPVGLQLSVWARRFDPKLSMPSIIQACRNAWTACGLQPLLGLPVKLTPSVLGYSLLYPYSDNYLDQERLTAEAKLRFSARFRRMLRGHALARMSHREAAIAALIGLIESEYPRAQYPEVFDSLIAIHRAQENSIRQISADRLFDASEVLRLSCHKGGTSVLADACLVRPALNANEQRFAFEWGVLLQLGDDLQDLKEDLNRGSITLFSLAASSGTPIDAFAIQLLQFGERVGQTMDELPHGQASLKELLKMSWQSLIIGAVAASHEYFSEQFLAEAERVSPFRFSFLRQKRQQLARRSGLYQGIFKAMLRARANVPLALPCPIPTIAHPIANLSPSESASSGACPQSEVKMI